MAGLANIDGALSFLERAGGKMLVSVAFILVVGLFVYSLAIVFYQIERAYKRYRRNKKIAKAQVIKAEREREQAEWERDNPVFDTSFMSACAIVEEHLKLRRGVSKGKAAVEAPKELRAAFARGDLAIEAKRPRAMKRQKLDVQTEEIKGLKFDVDYSGNISLMNKEQQKVFTELTVSKKQVLKLWPRYDDEYRLRKTRSS